MMLRLISAHEQYSSHEGGRGHIQAAGGPLGAAMGGVQRGCCRGAAARVFLHSLCCDRSALRSTRGPLWGEAHSSDKKEGAARLFGWKQADSRQRVPKDTCGKLAAWRGIDGGWWCESVASFMWGGVKKISRREVSVTLSFQGERARRRPVNRCPPVPFKASSFMLSPHTSTRSP